MASGRASAHDDLVLTEVPVDVLPAHDDAVAVEMVEDAAMAPHPVIDPMHAGLPVQLGGREIRAGSTSENRPGLAWNVEKLDCGPESPRLG